MMYSNFKKEKIQDLSLRDLFDLNKTYKTNIGIDGFVNQFKNKKSKNYDAKQ